jgi:hypothetical protein
MELGSLTLRIERKVLLEELRAPMSWCRIQYGCSSGALSRFSRGARSPLPDTRPILENGRGHARQDFGGDRVGDLQRLPETAQLRLAGLDDPACS